MGAGAAYDACGCETSDKSRRRVDVPRDGIYPASGPDGRKTLLLKVLQTNECGGDCAYCVNTCSRQTARAHFAPDELAGVFAKYLREGLVEGLFLSSGVGRDPEECMEEVLETVSIVRRRGFCGYVHTKILPGATRDQVARAARLSTRLSINIEVPGKARLSELSSTKDYGLDILRRMRWIGGEVKRGHVSAGQTTQFIVGASGEADSEILDVMGNLYEDMSLYRCYFSAFSPIKDTPLESEKPAPARRAHRLYQADFLLRQYDFSVEDIPVTDDGFLSLTQDPKTLYAQANPQLYPIDLNEADYALLLKVPGIGPKTATKIISEREKQKIRCTKDAKKIGVARKALSFIELAGSSQKRILEYT
ncbi:helix-hairpin-helix domain-containing protein [Patescibacteria group bacterium]|nr:helix-hairpin-helix domain-containing protein [Patescibacteria group bacterium]